MIEQEPIHHYELTPAPVGVWTFKRVDSELALFQHEDRDEALTFAMEYCAREGGELVLRAQQGEESDFGPLHFNPEKQIPISFSPSISENSVHTNL